MVALVLTHASEFIEMNNKSYCIHLQGNSLRYCLIKTTKYGEVFCFNNK